MWIASENVSAIVWIKTAKSGLSIIALSQNTGILLFYSDIFVIF